MGWPGRVIGWIGASLLFGGVYIGAVMTIVGAASWVTLDLRRSRQQRLKRASAWCFMLGLVWVLASGSYFTWWVAYRASERSRVEPTRAGG